MNVCWCRLEEQVMELSATAVALRAERARVQTASQQQVFKVCNPLEFPSSTLVALLGTGEGQHELALDGLHAPRASFVCSCGIALDQLQRTSTVLPKVYSLCGSQRVLVESQISSLRLTSYADTLVAVSQLPPFKCKRQPCNLLHALQQQTEATPYSSPEQVPLRVCLRFSDCLHETLMYSLRLPRCWGQICRLLPSRESALLHRQSRKLDCSQHQISLGVRHKVSTSLSMCHAVQATQEGQLQPTPPPAGAPAGTKRPGTVRVFSTPTGKVMQL